MNGLIVQSYLLVGDYLALVLCYVCYYLILVILKLEAGVPSFLTIFTSFLLISSMVYLNYFILSNSDSTLLKQLNETYYNLLIND